MTVLGATPPYPWQEEAWAYMLRCRDQQRIPHALLLTGPDGIGKGALADKMAALLLCAKTSLCGACPSCQLLAEGTHPDCYTLSPESGSAVIKIDQMRALIRSLERTAAQGSRQCVVINPAHALHPAAANAFLKTLEEPAGAVVMILVTDRPSALPPAIRSRCQQVRVSPPDMPQFSAWWGDRPSSLPMPALLELAAGVPLRALDFCDDSTQDQTYQELWAGIQGLLEGSVDPVVLAKQCLSQESHLGAWLSRLNILAGLMVRDGVGLKSAYLAATGTASKAISVRRCVRWLDAIGALRRIVEQQRIAVAPELQLMGVFSQLMDDTPEDTSMEAWGYA